MKNILTQFICFKTISTFAGALGVLLAFQNCSGGGSSKLSSQNASGLASCWNTVQNPASFQLGTVAMASLQLSGLNTVTPTLQASNATLSCNAANISAYPSYNAIKGYLTGLSICVGNLGNGDQVTTDVGSNNRADDGSVRPNGISFTQLKTALDQLIVEANAAGDCS